MRVLAIVGALPTEVNPSAGCFVKSQLDSLARAGVELEVLVVGGSPWKYVRSLPKFIAVAERSGFDLVHAHYGYCGLLARLQDSLPLVVSFMGGDVMGLTDARGRYTLRSSCLAALASVLARFADAVIVKSHRMKRRLGIGSAYVIPNGVDFGMFKPMDRSECRGRLGIASWKKVVLFVGNPAEPWKGFPLAQDTVGLVNQTMPEAQLMVLNNQPHSTMPLYMNAADVLLVTSHFEGSPNAVKEAMACNLPIVSVDVGDVSEVASGTAGCFICRPSAPSLSRDVLHALNDLRRTDGREKIRHLELGAVAGRVVRIYEDVLARRTTMPGRQS
ncbi:MAG: glycosyltransferase [Planctomycetota bacterium]|nr:glycosyltransferase [Planctomycetota bacterium]